MRVMWICNIPITVMRANKSRESKAFGGWMSSMANLLKDRPEIELAVCYPQNRTGSLEREENEGIRFFGFYVCDRCVYDENVLKSLREIQEAFQPDVIHIFGTEFPHSYFAMKLNPSKTLVDIQGLVGVYTQHYFTGLPASITASSPPLCTGRNVNPIYEDRMEMKSRSRFEKAVLKQAKYVTGRTDWDHACVRHINPTAKYFKCNRILRESFYDGAWRFSECRKHSILISQADYPVKGFHIFLKALSILKKKYADIAVTVAGTPLNLKNPESGTYDCYIRKLIKHYHLERVLTFTGLQDEKQMRDNFLKTNVFVMASLIENSPNSLGEAMMMGVPCVAANVGGTNNMLEHGVEGYLYQSDAGYMMAYYIEQIFDNPSLAADFSEQAKKKAAVTHDREKNVQTMIDIYNEIVEG